MQHGGSWSKEERRKNQEGIEVRMDDVKEEEVEASEGAKKVKAE